MEKDLVSRIVVLADMYFACLWKSAMKMWKCEGVFLQKVNCNTFPE